MRRNLPRNAPFIFAPAAGALLAAIADDGGRRVNRVVIRLRMQLTRLTLRFGFN
jgi:hypothetical protein